MLLRFKVKEDSFVNLETGVKQIQEKQNPTMENLQKWRKAGKISAQVLELGRSMIKKGIPLIEVCDAVDDKIVELGAKPSFPTQISLDSIAAHYCCPANDETALENQVAKIDAGAHIDGIPADNALTVDLGGNHSDLVKASGKALQEAVKIIRPGATLSEIGGTIQAEITSLGFSPIRNLSGHGISEFELHASPRVPNVAVNDNTALEQDQVIAIEPFATTGEGVIVETTGPEVFMEISKKPVRDANSRLVMKEIEQYQGMPFAKRWLLKKFSPAKTEFALRQLLQLRIIEGYPPLVERAKGIVSQAEHTVLVKENGCEVLTENDF